MIRPVQHVVESESENLLRRLLPAEWVIRKISIDYGVDYEIEIVDNGVVSGKRIWIQLKGTRNHLRKRRVTNKWTQEDASVVSFPMATKELEYSLSCPFPLLLFVADLSCNSIFWIPVQEEIRNSLEKSNPGWRTQETNTMRIPYWNKLDLSTKTYEGLRWYALEPSRVYALMQLHVFIDSKLYCIQSNFEFSDDFIEPFEKERMEEYLRKAQEVLCYALEIDILFGKNGVDVFLQFNNRIAEARVSISRAQRLLSTGRFTFLELSAELARVSTAISTIDTLIKVYFDHRRFIVES